MNFSRILVRATNWVGDAVMSLPALRLIRQRFPGAEITVLARPWVADLYARESFADRVILHTASRGARDWSGKRRLARALRAGRFDCALLLQNAFEAALLAWLARIPRRIGYNRDGRGFLLTDPVRVPRRGEIHPHQRYYYLEMLRRAGIVDRVPEVDVIQLEGVAEARLAGLRRMAAAGLEGEIIGVSPGAAYGTAKQWSPDHFAEAAHRIGLARGAVVAVFGSRTERELGEAVARCVSASGGKVHNFAGETSLGEFIELAAACRLFLTNDSGAMHVASALGLPTVAVFGPTDEQATGPVGPVVRVIREPVDCAPCGFRECPTDHRCMNRIPAARVAEAALDLLK